MAAQLRSNGRRGHTLVEVVVTGAVFAVLVTGICSMMRDAGGVFHATVRTSNARFHCNELTAVLGRELTGANPASLAVDASHAEGDRLQLQVPLSVANGVVSWGAIEHVDRSGATHANASVEYLLVGDPLRRRNWQLVRRLLDVGGAPIGADEVLVAGVDGVDARRGKGFAVSRSGDLVTLSVRVRVSADDDGIGNDDYVRQSQIVIRLRNS